MPAVTSTPAVPGTDATAALINAIRLEMLAARPIGEGKIWFTNTAPEDYLLVRGQTVSRVTYAALFAVIGTTFGAGDGSTTFRLPDGQDLFLMGVSASRVLGATGGINVIDLSHTHTVNSHTHSISGDGAHDHGTYTGNRDNNGPGGIYEGQDNVITASGGTNIGHSHQINAVGTHNHGGSTGATSVGTTSSLSSTQSIQNPFLAVNFIIRYQ